MDHKASADVILTPDQLRLLTNKRRHTAQVRELVLMGIPHRLRSDGSPVVLQDDLVSYRNKTAKSPPRLRLG